MPRHYDDLPQGFQVQASDIPEGFSVAKEGPSILDRARFGLSALTGASVGSGEALASMGSGAVSAPLAGLAGIAGTALPGPQGQGADFTNSVLDTLTFRPRTQQGQQIAGGIAKPFEAFEQFADTAGEVTGEPSDVLGATAVKTALLGAPAILGMRGLRQAPKPNLPALPTPKPKPKGPAPSIDDLRQQASQAYQRAENSGVFIKGESYSNFLKDLQETLAREGIDRGLHPDSMRAFRRAMADEGKNLTLKGAEVIRRNISDAASNRLRPSDQRMAMIMRDKFDQYVEGIGKRDLVGDGDARGAVGSLGEARGLWSRVRKAEEIEGMLENAGINAPNFSASGLENAIRTQFRQLARNPKRMRRFSPEEQAAIKQVAKGTTSANVLRFIGRYAPTGPVSSAISAGIGASIGGPVGAVLFGGAGGAGRIGATSLTKRNASRVDELVRRGRQE